jgi:hypothetical protein
MDPITEEAGRRTGNVLIVEDPFVRAFVKTYLVRHGYNVEFAEINDAIDGLRSGGLSPDLLITNRPGLFVTVAAAVPLLYIAAFPDPAEAAPYHRAHMLRKPFRPEQLLAAVISLLGGAA